MDWIRSAYVVPMIFRVGDDPVLVRWYFAAEDAKCFPQPHAFFSQNWGPGPEWNGIVGEQSTKRIWRNGSTPSNGANGSAFDVCFTDHPDWWLDGIPAGQESGPYNEDFLPECCVPCEFCPPGTGNQQVRVDVCDTDSGSGQCTCIPACPPGGGVFAILELTGPCQYTGTIELCGDQVDIQLDLTGAPDLTTVTTLQWGGNQYISDANTYECVGPGRFTGSNQMNVFETLCSTSLLFQYSVWPP